MRVWMSRSANSSTLAATSGPLDRVLGARLALDARVIALGLDDVVLEDALVPRLPQPLEQLPHHLLGAQHEVLVAQHDHPPAVARGLPQDLLVVAVVVVDGLSQRALEAAHDRGDRGARVPGDRHEHRIWEEPLHRAYVPRVERRLLAPALLAVLLGVAREDVVEELPELVVELLG